MQKPAQIRVSDSSSNPGDVESTMTRCCTKYAVSTECCENFAKLNALDRQRMLSLRVKAALWTEFQNLLPFIGQAK